MLTLVRDIAASIAITSEAMTMNLIGAARGRDEIGRIYKQQCLVWAPALRLQPAVHASSGSAESKRARAIAGTER